MKRNLQQGHLGIFKPNSTTNIIIHFHGIILQSPPLTPAKYRDHFTHQPPDVKVSVKCDGVKKLVVATTENDGSFKANLPSDKRSCFAKVLGGAVQLYASGKDQISQIIKGKEYNSYTISTPLSFRTSCPPRTNCKSGKQVGSSKTVDLPLPPEWGLAPSSYYVPFFPIIGIP
ncbi:hypothetical protein LR48_Vigan08g136100 [Vigna angularis]|uniref:Uncharacterized protein n=1 Tax=Phaseolus angularis TaxID=3914 RepID=A0A0L9V7A2_PHAAN|nr:hypothetical protein LR48_Vigan08g136100 [Vigna angularis]